jgi:hypothetical protein
LEFRIHQGFCHRGEEEPGAARQGPSLAERVVHMALNFAVGHDRPAFLVLDAFFCTAGVFRLARSVYSIVLKQPYLMILARAKKNYRSPDLRDYHMSPVSTILVKLISFTAAENRVASNLLRVPAYRIIDRG